MILLSGHAEAQSSTYDTVELVDGGVMRGTIIVYQEGEDLILELPTGESRTIPADRIARVVRAGQTAEPTETAAPTEEEASSAPAVPSDDSGPRAPRATSSPESAPALAPTASPPPSEPATWGQTADGQVPAAGSSTEKVVTWGIRGGLGAVGCFGCRRFAAWGRPGFWIEGAGFVDIRPGLGIYRLRVDLVLGVGAAPRTNATLLPSVRLWPLGLDLGDLFTLRVGGTVGLLFVPNFSSAGFVAGPAVEGAVTLMDRRLEVGGQFSTPIFIGGHNAQPNWVLQAFVAYTF